MNKNYSLHLCLAVLLVAVFVSQGFGQEDKTTADLKTIMKELNVIGLSVAVVNGNKIVYTRCLGLKNIENNTMLAENDIFRIASISKSFSATGIMQLVEAKKISLDDDFSKLTGFKISNPKYPKTTITLRMVMSHTSSINDSQGYFSFDSINPAKSASWAKCYNDYEPGKGYQYCNLNYNMTGAVIEKTSGERFDQYVKHHILDPLGIYGGYCVDSLNADRFATLYELDSASQKFIASAGAYNPRREELHNYEMGYSTPVFSPTGGMKISATDLAKYMMMHMNYGKVNGIRIMSKKSAKTMQTKIADEEGYGLAISTIDNLIPGKIMKGHTGSAYGLYSAMFFQPKEKFGIVVITNGCNATYDSGMNSVTKAVTLSLYNNLIEPVAKVKM